MAGQYLADFLSKKEADLVYKELKKGILMHRWLDHFSNNHDSLRTMNSYFRPSVGKYAPVASDIVCDYLLCQCWNKYFKIGFESFVRSAYKKLSNNVRFFPIKQAILFHKMRRGNWLMYYSSYCGLEKVFLRLNTRVKFNADFTKVLPVLISNKTNFIDLFQCFYSDALRETQRWHR